MCELVNANQKKMADHDNLIDTAMKQGSDYLVDEIRADCRDWTRGREEITT